MDTPYDSHNSPLRQSTPSDSNTAPDDSPLLGYSTHGIGPDDDDPDRGYQRDFGHLPWHRRPAIGWILVPYLVMALIFGGAITPKLNLIVDLICRQYYAEGVHVGLDAVTTSGFITPSPDQCRVAEVSQRASVFMMVGDLVGGILSAIVSPRLGSLSDLYGRKPILVVCSAGALLGEAITLYVAAYQETVSVNWLMVSFIVDGITGSGILAMAMVNTYATDCVASHQRSVAFGYLHGCMFVGLAIGPIVAGYIVKWSGSVVVVFWMLLAGHICCLLFVVFCAPESISKRRRADARRKASMSREGTRPWSQRLRHWNPLEPVQVLYPTGPGSTATQRRNLVILAAMDTVMYAVALGSLNVLLIYVNFEFGWQTFESGRYMTVVYSTRVVFLLVILPAVTYFARDKRRNPAIPSKGSTLFDLTVIRVGVACETLGWLGYSLSRNGSQFTASGIVQAAGGMSSPALQSALTKYVPSDQTGQLLGANGLLHATTQIIAPILFNVIFALTVGKYSQAVFVCLAATFLATFLISWLVKPTLYDDGDALHDVSSGPQAHGESLE